MKVAISRNFRTYKIDEIQISKFTSKFFIIGKMKYNICQSTIFDYWFQKSCFKIRIIIMYMIRNDSNCNGLKNSTITFEYLNFEWDILLYWKLLSCSKSSTIEMCSVFDKKYSWTDFVQIFHHIIMSHLNLIKYGQADHANLMNGNIKINWYWFYGILRL